MRIHMWLLFIECLLYTKSFMFISTFFIPFLHFICISTSRNLRLRGVESPNWCYKATECQIWIESRSAWLWSLRENCCGIQVNVSLSWYQVTCVATCQTEFISWSMFALKTDNFTIHLTYGKKSTNIHLDKSHMLPECQFHANLHRTYLDVLSEHLPHYWSGICLSSSPTKWGAMGWNYGKK